MSIHTLTEEQMEVGKSVYSYQVKSDGTLRVNEHIITASTAKRIEMEPKCRRQYFNKWYHKDEAKKYLFPSPQEAKTDAIRERKDIVIKEDWLWDIKHHNKLVEENKNRCPDRTNQKAQLEAMDEDAKWMESMSFVHMDHPKIVWKHLPKDPEKNVYGRFGNREVTVKQQSNGWWFTYQGHDIPFKGATKREYAIKALIRWINDMIVY